MTDTWRDLASCRPGGGYDDHDLWFDTRPSMVQLAQQVCNNICPVRDQCLWTGRTEGTGIWGGVLHNRKQPGPSPSRDYIQLHGTTGGYARHRRRGETPCQRCLDASRLYEQGRVAGL